MTPPLVAVIDYGMGNVRSAEKALEHVGARSLRTSDLERLAAADGLVLPGDGAFPRAVARIEALGIDDLLRDRIAAGVPVLGICVGMQVLFESSTERGGSHGLGLLEGRVEALAASGLKLPQIGWNAVSWRRESVLNVDLPEPCPFYHVHSYAPLAARIEDVVGTAVYGHEFVSVVAHERLYGVQFHPEKSGRDGLHMLSSFVQVCEAATSRRRPAAA